VGEAPAELLACGSLPTEGRPGVGVPHAPCDVRLLMCAAAGAGGHDVRWSVGVLMERGWKAVQLNHRWRVVGGCCALRHRCVLRGVGL
jgi:hypothetical protein